MFVIVWVVLLMNSGCSFVCGLNIGSIGKVVIRWVNMFMKLLLGLNRIDGCSIVVWGKVVSMVVLFLVLVCV